MESFYLLKETIVHIYNATAFISNLHPEVFDAFTGLDLSNKAVFIGSAVLLFCVAILAIRSVISFTTFLFFWMAEKVVLILLVAAISVGVNVMMSYFNKINT